MTGVAPRGPLAGATVRMAGLTMVSRATGFVRTVVVAAVLGAGYLGNLYQSTNAVPNIVFELFAAGVLQTVLVPVMVDVLDRDGADDAERAAGAVFGLVATVLAGLAAVGLVLAPWIVRGLVAGVDDPVTRDAMVRTGTVFLWFFLPQVVLYAANLVATAVLNARGRFGLPAFAPAVNNVIVVGAYLIFAAMRGGEAPGVSLSAAEILVLAGGTTLGVVAFCLVPVVGARRVGVRLRPRWEPRHPAVRRLLRQGAWGAVYVGSGQVLLLAVIVLANGVEGGVVVVQVAQILFLLPHALVSVPIATTVVPTLTRAARDADMTAYREALARSARSLLYLTSIAAALVAGLSAPISRVVVWGNAADRTAEVGDAIAAFAPGIVGFGLALLFARAAYAVGDARTPAVVSAAVALAGVGVCTVLALGLPDRDRGVALGLGFSLAQVVGGVVLAGVAAKGRLGLASPVLRALLGGGAAGATAFGVSRLFVDTGRPVALLALVLGGAAGLAAGVGANWALGGPSPKSALRTLGAGT